MLKFGILFICFIGVVFILSYFPTLKIHRELVNKQNVFNKQLDYLNSIEWNNFVITDRLGEGGNEGKGIDFAVTEKNQDRATASVLELMRKNFI